MNFKPFYVSTEGITAKQAQDLFNLAVKNGAEGHDGIYGEASQYKPTGIVYLDRYNYIGVDELGGTFTFMCTLSYGIGAVELTYEQALDHVQGSVIVKEKLKLEAGKTYKLINKEEYLQEFLNNYGYLEREFTGPCVTLDHVDEDGDGWVRRALVISTNELEYFELVDPIGYVKGITSVDENKPKLKVTKERPTSGQFIATWIYDGKPWSFTYKWIDGVIHTPEQDTGIEWEPSVLEFKGDIEIWYTIIK